VRQDLNPSSYAFGSGIVSPPLSRKSSKSTNKSWSKNGASKKSTTGPIMQKNPADSYFGKEKRKNTQSAEENRDSDLREHYRSTSPSVDSPFRSTSDSGSFGANDPTIKDDPLIFTSPSSQISSSKPKLTADIPSRFETYFESDFDPFRDTATAERQNVPRSSSSLKEVSPSTSNADGGNSTSFSLYDRPTARKLMTGGYSGLSHNGFDNAFNAELSRVLHTPPLTGSSSSSHYSLSPKSPSPQQSLSLKRGEDGGDGGGFEKAVALFDYNAQEDGDLSFKKGDVITIVKRSESTDDWWTGVANTSSGVFPANYVEVV